MALPKLALDGYEFLGWYDGDKRVETIPAGSTGDKTFTAKWSAIEYTITLNNNGTVITDKYTIEESVALPKPTLEGYEFLGWYDGDKRVETIPAGSTGNKTFIAKWSAIEYTITYNNNGTVITDKYTIEESVTLPKPTLEGYEFLGWYNGDKRVETIPEGSTGDKTFTAKWAAIEYTITYNNNGTVTTDKYTVEESVTLPKPARDGYDFLGWYDGDKLVETIPIGSTGDKTFTAKWAAVDITIVFVTEADRVTVTATYGDTVTPPSAPEKTGYVFVGWYDEEGARFDPTEKVTAGATYTARYERTESTLVFDFNDGRTPDVTLTLKYGDAIVPPTPPDREGYEFVGWLTVAGDELGSSDTASGDATYVAEWERVMLSVTFVLGNGEADVVKEVPYGETPDMIPAPEREGHTFAGWTADGKPYSSAPVTADITLTASWSVDILTVTFFCDECGIDVSRSVEYGQTVEAPAAPEREGYVFVGWMADDGIFDLASPVTKDMVLTAAWEKVMLDAVFIVDGEVHTRLQVAYGDTLTPPVPITGECEAFTGWYADEGLTTPYAFGELTSSVTIYGGLIPSHVYGEDHVCEVCGGAAATSEHVYENGVCTICGKTEKPVWQGDVSEALEGEGTEQSPYLIASGADLAYLSVHNSENGGFADAYFLLTQDIDLGGREWTPIGTGHIGSESEDDTYAFKGHFDGGGHTVKGGVITRAGGVGVKANSVGLFGMISGGSVTGLAVEIKIAIADLTDDESLNVGGMVGSAMNAEISDSVAVADISLDGAPRNVRMGLIVGHGKKCTVAACTASGTMSVTGASSAMIGGAVGSMYDSLVKDTDVDVDITIACDSASAGGLIGSIEYSSNLKKNSASACRVTGDITVTDGEADVAEICADYTDHLNDCVSEVEIHLPI